MGLQSYLEESLIVPPNIRTRSLKDGEIKAQLEELLNFLHKKGISYDPENENRVINRLRFTKTQLGLTTYKELLARIQEDAAAYQNMVAWLEKGQIRDGTNRTFNPLVSRKMTLSDYARVQPKARKKKRKYRNLKQLSDMDFGAKPPPDPENIPLILDILSSQNVNFQAYKKNYFTRRLQGRMRRLELTTYLEYSKYLETHLTEKDELIDTFSINVTHFFRDKELFKALENDILPQILAKSRRPIRIWSAGCAVGCEPYSIAILIDKIGSNLRRSEVRILATDLSQDFLDQAKEGQYGTESFREMEVSVFQTYFTRISSGIFQLLPDMRRIVEFRYHDLRSNPPNSKFDLILCRNVLIYFSRSQAELLFQRFYSVLNPGAFLAIGKCELLHPIVRDKFTTVDPQNRIYQRISEE